MTDDDIKSARALCEAATGGKWRVWTDREWSPTDPGGLDVFSAPGDGSMVRIATVNAFDNREAIAAFIAAARTLVPSLLEALESARRDVEQWRSWAREHEAARNRHREALNRIANRLGVVHEDDKIEAAVRALEAARDFASSRRADKAERDLAATKAALAEAKRETALAKSSLLSLILVTEAVASDSWREDPAFVEQLAALKAKVRP